MNKAPLVSILIPCYNHEKYVVNTLNSILNDTYPTKEIIIIDDGSKDNSVAEIERWAEDNSKNIVVNFLSRPNKGLSATLNELVKLANGEFVTMLASDDLLTSNSIAVRVKALQNNPQKYVVIGDAYVIDSEGNKTLNSAIVDLYYGNKDNYKTDDGLKHSVVNQWSVPGPVMLARKSVYDIIGLYPENLLAEDLNFYLQVIGRGLLMFIDETVAEYRVHDFNLCRAPEHKKNIILAIVKSYLNNLKYYDNKNKIRMLRLALWNGLAYMKNSLLK